MCVCARVRVQERVWRAQGSVSPAVSGTRGMHGLGATTRTCFLAPKPSPLRVLGFDPPPGGATSSPTVPPLPFLGRLCRGPVTHPGRFTPRRWAVSPALLLKINTRARAESGHRSKALIWVRAQFPHLEGEDQNGPRFTELLIRLNSAAYGFRVALETASPADTESRVEAARGWG